MTEVETIFDDAERLLTIAPLRRQLQGQREVPVGQLSRSCRGEKNGEVEVTVLGPRNMRPLLTLSQYETTRVGSVP